DFIDAVKPADNQSFQIQFRCDAQIQVDIQGVVVRDEWTCYGSAGDRLHHRSFHFDEATRIQKAPDRLHYLAALYEDLAHIRIHRQIDIALAIAQLNVGQAVILFRKRKECLRQELYLFHMNREFSGSGAEQITGYAYVIAQIEQLEQLKALFSNKIE